MPMGVAVFSSIDIIPALRAKYLDCNLHAVNLSNVRI